MKWLINKIIGTKHQRDIKRIRPLVDEINRLDESFKSLSDDELRAKTAEFKERFAGGETLDSLLCEAFAVVKNACRRLVGTKAPICDDERVWDMVPFDVQIVGGIVLHQGKIAEMATGEGKTLVATMPLYLNALTGKNVHLVTVNDYLARRDSEWMGCLYKFLGLTVGCIQDQMRPDERRREYACDITYGTNSQFGFDYLRDNGTAQRPEDVVQREHFFAIIDEVDSILIDEARTPLIISGPAPHSSHQYVDLKPRVEELVRRQRDLCNRLMKECRDCIEQENIEKAKRLLYQVHQGMPKNKQLLHLLEDASARKMLEQAENMMLTDIYKEEARTLREELFFTIDEKGHDATLTEKGCATMNPSDPEAYVMPDIISELGDLDASPDLSEQEKIERRQAIQESFSVKSERIHNVDQLIRAYSIYERDVEYVVQDNQVLIVDEFTGRILPGRRWSDGLHQAIEAKEGVRIERETQTLATITIQNYFRMYDKLAGMTGTAETEANEFKDIYQLDVVVIPTNRPVRRVDLNDAIFRTQREKYKAIINEIRDCHQKGQPVLVGTVSVESSELLSRMLKSANIPHNVLNAKNHQREAEIVMRAGQPGAVTIATNMAGRGTDIKLGEGVVRLDRETIVSNIGLNDKINGDTLKKRLLDDPCGLYVIGSERHESRRIDRQLRGRCARQGDPGFSRFYISLEDDLMRLFGSDRISNIMRRLGMEEGQQLEHPWLNRSVETAQRRVEQHNYSIRKRTLEYDDVMNKQREIIYSFRADILRNNDTTEHIHDIVADIIETKAEEMILPDNPESLNEFTEWVNTTFPVGWRSESTETAKPDPAAIASEVFEMVKQAYTVKTKFEDQQSLPDLERWVMLRAIDSQWQEYLRNMDSLRQGVGLRAYGQRDPLVEYKKEAFAMFGDLMTEIKTAIAVDIFRASTRMDVLQRAFAASNQRFVHDEVSAMDEAFNTAIKTGSAAREPARGNEAVTVRRESKKVGRNDPCPCGSGKKYKKCCGA